MEIVVLPKRAVPGIDTPLSWAMISIATKYDWPEFDEKNCVKATRLSFEDKDPSAYLLKDDPNNPMKLFTEKQANMVIDFVEEVKDKIEMLVVHCEAGISRSPAVAGAISKVLFGDDSAFFKGPYKPNMHVYRTIIDAAHKRELI